MNPILWIISRLWTTFVSTVAETDFIVVYILPSTAYTRIYIHTYTRLHAYVCTHTAPSLPPPSLWPPHTMLHCTHMCLFTSVNVLDHQRKLQVIITFSGSQIWKENTASTKVAENRLWPSCMGTTYTCEQPNAGRTRVGEWLWWWWWWWQCVQWVQI